MEITKQIYYPAEDYCSGFHLLVIILKFRKNITQVFQDTAQFPLSGCWTFCIIMHKRSKRTWAVTWQWVHPTLLHTVVHLLIKWKGRARWRLWHLDAGHGGGRQVWHCVQNVTDRSCLKNSRWSKEKCEKPQIYNCLDRRIHQDFIVQYRTNFYQS